MSKQVKNPLSYRSEVLIAPNWNRIVRWYFPELKTDGEASKFVASFAKKFRIDADESLYSKHFSFLEFYDGHTGLNMIWSRNYQLCVGL